MKKFFLLILISFGLLPFLSICSETRSASAANGKSAKRVMTPFGTKEFDFNRPMGSLHGVSISAQDLYQQAQQNNGLVIITAAKKNAHEEVIFSPLSELDPQNIQNIHDSASTRYYSIVKITDKFDLFDVTNGVIGILKKYPQVLPKQIGIDLLLGHRQLTQELIGGYRPAPFVYTVPMPVFVPVPVFIYKQVFVYPNGDDSRVPSSVGRSSTTSLYANGSPTLTFPSDLSPNLLSSESSSSPEAHNLLAESVDLEGHDQELCEELLNDMLFSEHESLAAESFKEAQEEKVALKAQRKKRDEERKLREKEEKAIKALREEEETHLKLEKEKNAVCQFLGDIESRSVQISSNIAKTSDIVKEQEVTSVSTNSKRLKKENKKKTKKQIHSDDEDQILKLALKQAEKFKVDSPQQKLVQKKQRSLADFKKLKEEQAASIPVSLDEINFLGTSLVCYVELIESNLQEFRSLVNIPEIQMAVGDNLLKQVEPFMNLQEEAVINGVFSDYTLEGLMYSAFLLVADLREMILDERSNSPLSAKAFLRCVRNFNQFEHSISSDYFITLYSMEKYQLLKSRYESIVASYKTLMMKNEEKVLTLFKSFETKEQLESAVYEYTIIDGGPRDENLAINFVGIGRYLTTLGFNDTKAFITQKIKREFPA